MSEKYRPSNGTEGECFFGEWCAHCERDKAQNGTKNFDDCQPEELCPIIAKTFVYDTDEPEYPVEWITDEEQGPRCTAFVEKGKPIPPARDEFTLELPL